MLKPEGPWCLKLHFHVNQSKNCSQVDHIPLLEHGKTLHYFLQWGSHSFEGFSPLWSPLLGKAIKATLFCFTQNCLHISIRHWWTELLRDWLMIPVVGCYGIRTNSSGRTKQGSITCIPDLSSSYLFLAVFVIGICGKYSSENRTTNKTKTKPKQTPNVYR